MPIQSDLYPVTDENIALSPAQVGVYQLQAEAEVIYIGRAMGARRRPEAD